MMENIIKTLKIARRGNSQLSDEKISDAFNKGVIFTSTFVNEEDYNSALKIFGFDMNATNQTFYPTLESVLNKSEFELDFWQMIYYMNQFADPDTKYVYSDEDRAIVKDIVSKNYVVINVLGSLDFNKTLSNYVMNTKQLSFDINEYFKWVDTFNLDVDVFAMKSRTLKYAFMKRYNIAPRTIQELLGMIVPENCGVMTRRKMFNILTHVRDDETISLLMKNILLMSNKALERESQTYRKELLAIRKIAKSIDNKEAVTLLNKITKDGKKSHVAKKKSFLEEATNLHFSNDEFSKQLSTLSNLQLFRLFSGIKSRLNNVNTFLIKTAKLASKERNKLSNRDVERLNRYLGLVEAELKNRFNEVKKIKLDKNINLALPTSYRQFIGNVPYFTEVNNLSGDMSVGIIWLDEGDYDLHCNGIHNDTKMLLKYGFCDNKNSAGITFSGDVTHVGPHGAAEYMSVSNEAPFDKINFTANLFANSCGDVMHAQVFIKNGLSFDLNTDTPEIVIPVEDFRGHYGMLDKSEHKFILVNLPSGQIDTSTRTKVVDASNFIEGRNNSLLHMNEFVELVGWEIVDNDYEAATNDEGEVIEEVLDFRLASVSQKLFQEVFGA